MSCYRRFDEPIVRDIVDDLVKSVIKDGTYLTPRLHQLFFNGYTTLIPGYTYTGGELAVKDWENTLQISPADTIPTGGRLSGGVWVDNDGLGNDLHPYALVSTPTGLVKDYLTLTARTDTEAVVIGDKRQWGTFWFTCTTAGTTGSGDPAVGAIGDTLIADGATVKWTNSGHYKLERRYLNAPAVTNKCLADYPRPSDGAELSSGSPTIGKRYRISAQSLVDFTTIGAANNTVGTEFVATAAGVTLTADDKLIPIIDGLGTVATTTRQNISNLVLAGDVTSTLTVVAILAADLEGAVDEHGEPVSLVDFVQTYDGDYLGYELDNSGGVAVSEVVVGGTTANTNIHTYSIYAMANIGTGVLLTNGNPALVSISTATMDRAELIGITPVSAFEQLKVRANPAAIISFLLPNLTETAATLPLMEANTTRAANVNDSTWPSSVAGIEGAISISVIPMSEGQTATLFSNYTDADNYIEIHCDATTLYFNKRIGGVDNQSSVAYSHAALTEFTAQAYWDSTGSGIRYSESGGAFSAYGTDADTTASVLSTTASIGHKNSLNQVYAYEPELKSYKTKALMEADE